MPAASSTTGQPRGGAQRAIIIGLGIMGAGALVVVQGWLADTVGLQNSFWLTAACEVYVIFYALWGSKPVVRGQAAG